MKKWKIALVLACLFLFNNLLFCQDTIFYKKNGNIVVHVKEVSQTEVQYKKIEMPDGPMYIISKNDIEKIVYKNGYVEVIKPIVSSPVEESTSSSYTPPVILIKENITYEDTKKRYNSMLSLINRHPDIKRQENLTQLARSIRSLKRHQDGTRTGAIVFGAFALAGAGLFGVVNAIEGGYADPLFIAPPIAFGGLSLILGTTSIVINTNLKQKRKDFVRLYNE